MQAVARVVCGDFRALGDLSSAGSLCSLRAGILGGLEPPSKI